MNYQYSPTSMPLISDLFSTVNLMGLHSDHDDDGLAFDCLCEVDETPKALQCVRLT